MEVSMKHTPYMDSPAELPACWVGVVKWVWFENLVGVVTFSLIASKNEAWLSDSTPSEKLGVLVPLVTMLHISLRTTRSCLLGVATVRWAGLNFHL